MAEADDSPLHRFFEWDDQKAGKRYRLDQARQLVGCIEIVVKISGKLELTKAFHNVKIVHVKPTEPENRYVSVRAVSQSTLLKRQVLRNAIRELEGWKARYAQYAKLFGPLFTDIERGIDKTRRNHPDL